MKVGKAIRPPPAAILRDVLLVADIRPVSLLVGVHTLLWGLLLAAHPAWLFATPSGEALRIVPLPLEAWPVLFAGCGAGHLIALAGGVGRGRRWFAGLATLLWLSVAVAVLYGAGSVPPVEAYFVSWVSGAFWTFLRLQTAPKG